MTSDRHPAGTSQVFAQDGLVVVEGEEQQVIVGLSDVHPAGTARAIVAIIGGETRPDFIGGWPSGAGGVSSDASMILDGVYETFPRPPYGAGISYYISRFRGGYNAAVWMVFINPVEILAYGMYQGLAPNDELYPLQAFLRSGWQLEYADWTDFDRAPEDIGNEVWTPVHNKDGFASIDDSWHVVGGVGEHTYWRWVSTIQDPLGPGQLQIDWVIREIPIVTAPCMLIGPLEFADGANEFIPAKYIWNSHGQDGQWPTFGGSAAVGPGWNGEAGRVESGGVFAGNTDSPNLCIQPRAIYTVSAWASQAFALPEARVEVRFWRANGTLIEAHVLIDDPPIGSWKYGIGRYVAPDDAAYMTFESFTHFYDHVTVIGECVAGQPHPCSPDAIGGGVELIHIRGSGHVPAHTAPDEV